MRRAFCVACLVGLLAVSLCSGAESVIGVVLLHGKNGYPGNPYVTGLAGKLRKSDILVNIPEMPYSRNRTYDRTYQDTIAEIDAAAAELKKEGATRIIIAGHSLGANVALYYAARVKVDGVIAIAPGHTPELKNFQNRVGRSVDRAREMVQEGTGDVPEAFDDINQGRPSTVRTTPAIYLSWFDPEGPAVMPGNAAHLLPGTALLWVVGTRDPLYSLGPSYAFDNAPPHPSNKYLVVNADHLNTPSVAAEEIIAWIKSANREKKKE